MKKLIVNGKEINYYIDYIRVKDTKNPWDKHTNTGYYNCDLVIGSDKVLMSYDREKIADNIRNIISEYDEDIKKLRAIESMYASGVVDLEKLHNLVVDNKYPIDKE